jgi:hypothetical protein
LIRRWKLQFPAVDHIELQLVSLHQADLALVTSQSPDLVPSGFASRNNTACRATTPAEDRARVVISSPS